MAIRKRREQCKQTAIVVLEGLKVSTDNRDVAPLCKAVRELVNPHDEILVLTLLHVNTGSDSSSAGEIVPHHFNRSCEAAIYMRFLHEEISQKKEIFLRVFRPFYSICKSHGVKIAAGFRLKDIILEEANNVKATLLVVDTCFARHLTLRLSGTHYNLCLVNEEEDDVSRHCLQANDEPPERSSARDTAQNPKSPKLRKESSSEYSYVSPPAMHIHPIMFQETEDQPINQPCTDNHQPPTETADDHKRDYHISIKAEILLGQALELTWEMIEEITQGFKSRVCDRRNSNCMSYYGYLKDHDSLVLVKKYNGDYNSILEAEKRAALCLHHKNILTLIGYHKSEHGIILVFPWDKIRTLEKLIWELSRQRLELRFQEKLKIAIGIAHGIRYIHEESTGGPIVHGRLQPINIFLTSDMKPMISGFEDATWLQVRRELQYFSHRYQDKDCLDHGSMVLIKSDIFSFGVVLLRLFCKKAVPEDDKSLIEWARPLLLDRAFHLLLDDENSDDLDMHEMFRVMATARMCTMSNPLSRPCISEVISILKGDDFCIIQSSPSISETNI